MDDLRDEIGLGVLAEYDGRPPRSHPLVSIEDWQLALSEAAEAAGELCSPYLQGKQSDLAEINAFIEGRIEKSGIKEKKIFVPEKRTRRTALR